MRHITKRATLLTWSVLITASELKGEIIGARVRQAIAEAKANSSSESTIPAPAILATGVDDFDTVLADYSVVLAEPVKTVVSSENPNGIETWYKLRILERIIEQKDISTSPLSDVTIPAALLPIASDEVVLREPGGELNVDGVTVKEKKPIDLTLEPNTRYLLCLFFQSRGEFAALPALRDGIFSLTPDNNLAPLGSADRPLARDIQRRFSNRLDTIRTYISQHHSSKAVQR